MMIKIFSAILMMLSLSAAMADEAPALKAQYTAQKFGSDLYVIHGPTEVPNPGNQGFMNNPAFIILKAGVVVVDPGASVQSGKMVLSHIKKLTDKPVIAVFNTHVHGDHWLGNDAIARVYPDVKIYSHPNTIKHVEQDGAGEEWTELMLNLTEGATKGTKIVAPNHPLNNGEKVVIGDETFRVIDTELAHTDSDIMIIAEKRKILFTGDNVCNTRIVRTSSVSGNIKALTNVLDEDITTVVPGHGPSGGKDVIANYRDYLATVYDGVKHYYSEEDLSDFEIKPLLHAKLGKWSSWSGFEEEYGKHVNQAYLEIEAADF